MIDKNKIAEINEIFEHVGNDVVLDALEEDLKTAVGQKGCSMSFRKVCYMLAKGTFRREGETVVFSEDGINPEVIEYLKKTFIDMRLECKKLSALNLFDSAEAFARGVLRNYCSISVEKVAYQLLNIEQSDRVGIMTSGYSCFGAYSSGICPSATFEEIDENEKSLLRREMMTDILGGNIRFRRENIFDLPDKGEKYSKLFLACPWKSYSPIPSNIVERYPWLAPIRAGKRDVWGELFPTRKTPTSCLYDEWDIASLAVDLLDKDGKAVVVMHAGDGIFDGKLTNAESVPARRRFIEEGLVESIVFLPTNCGANETYKYYDIALVVLSRGNDKVRFVDFRKEFKPRSKRFQLSNEDVERFASALSTDSKNALDIKNEDILRNESRLHAEFYETHILDPGEKLPLSAFINEIREGVSLSAEDINKMTSPEQTNIKYITPCDLGACGIEGEPRSLSKKMVAQRFKDQYVKNKSLIIPKNPPHKIAIMDIPKTKKILVDSNFYIIEVDEDKVNPHYLAAFLLSDKGASLLDKLNTEEGKNSWTKVLKKIEIPVPPMPLQNGIGQMYQAKIRELKRLRKRFETEAKKLKTVYPA